MKKNSTQKAETTLGLQAASGASPDPQVVAGIQARYEQWLIARETKRLQGRRGHWIGKKVASTQA